MKHILKIIRNQSTLTASNLSNSRLSPEFQIGQSQIGWVEMPNSIESALIQTLYDYTSETKGLRYEIEKAQSRIREVANLNNPVISKNKKDFHIIQYGRNEALAHLVFGFQFYYGACHQIFHQLKNRIPDYLPKSILDVGTGPGTALWAAKHHLPSLNSSIGVDISSDMLELARKMHQHQSFTDFESDWQRQFKPSTTHDIVSCAFTLSEIPSEIVRKSFIKSLWDATKDVLILVERGNPFGSDLINEAREHIIKIQEPLHILAPCPHEKTCPMKWCHFGQRVRLTSTFVRFVTF